MRVLDRQVLHLDVADFPVAVERVADARLRERPVVVAPPAVRALALSVSAEARWEGIRPGMPVQEARRRCRGLVVLPPNEPLYARAFRAVVELSGRFSPLIEPGPQGRVYLDATGTAGLFGPPVDLAARLRQELLASLRLDAAVGVAVNKLVSRVAADLTEPSGLLDVRAGEEAPFLAPLKVGRLPGVGGVVIRELKALNVRIVRQLAAIEVEHLALAFGRVGIVLHQRARGIDPRPVCPPVRQPEIRRETTLGEDTNELVELRAALRALVESAGRELRALGMTAFRLDLKIRYADARKDRGTGRFASPSSLDPELWRAADALLRRTLSRRVRVRGLELWLGGLARRPVQLGLFENETLRRERELTTALDRIRSRHGEGAVGSGLTFRHRPRVRNVRMLEC